MNRWKNQYHLVQQILLDQIFLQYTIRQKKINGFFLLPDEVDPDEFTEYCMKKKIYIEDRETLYYFICYSLKRSINDFYKEIKAGKMSYGLNTFRNKEQYRIIEDEIKERFSEGVKIIRRTQK